MMHKWCCFQWSAQDPLSALTQHSLVAVLFADLFDLFPSYGGFRVTHDHKQAKTRLCAPLSLENLAFETIFMRNMACFLIFTQVSPLFPWGSLTLITSSLHQVNLQHDLVRDADHTFFYRHSAMAWASSWVPWAGHQHQDRDGWGLRMDMVLQW